MDLKPKGGGVSFGKNVDRCTMEPLAQGAPPPPPPGYGPEIAWWENKETNYIWGELQLLTNTRGPYRPHRRLVGWGGGRISNSTRGCNL